MNERNRKILELIRDSPESTISEKLRAIELLMSMERPLEEPAVRHTAE